MDSKIDNPKFEKAYFEAHIPHRINLLITFRERYSKTLLKPDDIRDFYRCSKDISMFMVRSLLNELGIVLPKKKADVIDDASKARDWVANFGVPRLTVDEIRKDKRYENVKIVLKAANRAIAHITPDDVDHSIKLDSDNKILFDAIDFTEEMIKEKMYRATGRDYKSIMALPDNNMNRTGTA
jgi:hypothetical protein